MVTSVVVDSVVLVSIMIDAVGRTVRAVLVIDVVDRSVVFNLGVVSSLLAIGSVVGDPVFVESPSTDVVGRTDRAVVIDLWVVSLFLAVDSVVGNLIFVESIQADVVGTTVKAVVMDLVVVVRSGVAVEVVVSNIKLLPPGTVFVICVPGMLVIVVAFLVDGGGVGSVELDSSVTVGKELTFGAVEVGAKAVLDVVIAGDVLVDRTIFGVVTVGVVTGMP